MNRVELRAVYDDQVRGSFARRLPTGWTATTDGPLTRCLTTRGGFAMLTGAGDELSPDDLARLVGRTRDFYRSRDRSFEWKTFDHDRADLRPLLEAAGAVAEPSEALVLGEASRLAGRPDLPPTTRIRQVTDRRDLEHIAALQSEVWDQDWSWLATDLQARLDGPEPIEVFVAEDLTGPRADPAAQPVLVAAAWLVPMAGTEVAGLWGGATRASHRGRGVYRSLVAVRARRAVELGYRFLQVDASDDSRPILERLGLQVVGGTQPYRLDVNGADRCGAPSR